LRYQPELWGRHAMENKSKELGIFTIGLGLIGALLTTYVVMALAGPAPASPMHDGAAFRLAILMIPSIVFIASGIVVLAFPSRTTIKMVVALLTLALIADALLSFNPIKCLISFGVICLVWKTARQALSQLSY
jgi:hypothetical protein